MKKLLSIRGLVIVVCMSMIIGNVLGQTNVLRQTKGKVKVSSITFKEVNDKFGVKSSLTDLQKDKEWAKYEGKCVEWRGELAHLDKKWLFSGFDIGFKHLPNTFTYDVLLSAGKEAEAELLKLRQGTTYTYRATLESYGGAIIPISADMGCKK